ncbi:MAG: hypothetical protein AAB588_01720 [Patescibacteria group bacterium]
MTDKLAILTEVDVDFLWDSKKIWASPLPVESMPIEKLLWHFEYPFLDKECSIPNCSKKAEAIHHTQRFALSHSHDPRFLAPLCKSHHIIAHSIDLKFHKSRLAASP